MLNKKSPVQRVTDSIPSVTAMFFFLWQTQLVQDKRGTHSKMKNVHTSFSDHDLHARLHESHGGKVYVCVCVCVCVCAV